MFKKVILIFSLILFCTINASAQSIIVPQNKLFQHLLRNTSTVFSVQSDCPRKSAYPDPSKTLLPLTDQFKLYVQDLVCSDKALYIFISGTGRVYKATNWNEKTVEFKRIDSTNFFGYNFNALNFAIKDSLFSFGGYGFWHTNGQLRFFTEKNEWERMILNKEIAYPDYSHHTFNNDKSKLFWGLYNLDNDTKNSMQLDSVYELNIPEKTVNTLGHSSFNMVPYLHWVHILTPRGIFFADINNDGSNILFDFEHNAVFRTAPNKSNDYFKYFQSSNKNEPVTYFYQDGYIYSSKYPYQNLDSVKFEMSSFVKTNETIYTPLEHNGSKLWLYISLFIIILFLIVGVVVFMNRKKISKNRSKSPLIENTVSKSDLLQFSDLETSFINELIFRSKKNGFCSIDEINNLLGVGQKSVEIQKKARTDFVTKINQIFKEFKKTDEDFIIRVRSEEDKRSFNYSIPEVNQQLLKTIKK
jgi:uncharacterized protein YneF (UPF0154 family)